MTYPTWSDLNSPSIVPPLGARQAPDIGPVAVMVSTEPDLRYLEGTCANFKRHPFFMGRILTSEEEGISIAGPYIGAPYGVMLLESLVAKGARTIIILGWCGAVSPTLGVGDLLIPSQGLVDEGTSRHYAVLDNALPHTQPDPVLSKQVAGYLDSLEQRSFHLPVWTTDAIYRETAEKVSWYAGKGAHAVEMECSALFAAAAFRHIRAAALLVVSDSLISDSGDWDPGFRNKRFKTARRTASQAVMAVARKLT